MIQELNGLETITVFVEDLAACRQFYEEVFGLKALYQDDASAAYGFGKQMINLLASGEAPELIAPASVGAAGAGPRFLFTIPVEDADAVCEALKRHGVSLLNGPIDRPWGRRTAAFRDPAGTVWEVAQVLAQP